MTTATTYRPIRIATLPEMVTNDLSMEHLREGMGTAVAELGVSELHETLRGHDDDDEEHPALLAFERMVDAATAEIALDVARLLTEAINRRLPWTWEPER